ncbi:bifunctional UDP-sugar hydrolase/5'-nucleotidase UshA [Psychrobium sp. 1_MG-2023]|uniref:bifunctional UDP-sugar hydrolase/5'-nucleotidase UshA n=1 Tax=Psychrobium sp. 1_MG-2023 TaxID=3062624 RepID=UPI000C32BB6C|nr:bifunctional UDP-sugar hydrolase/5'-nucleotidase UshA [Psychrobium sp. 1_MG-2023]MDP2561376.1 bifunctional UDP-sugar hydrolase/5'-nucleotidase UshA [Psychrobium sp. 1_MG-2023]PKF54857.1 bifunctional UDP-sugar hydrolase/5'-nucleotidase [Alteromonadales bacterium alter-6D02]
MRNFILIPLIVLLAACGQTYQAKAPQKTHYVTVLHTNDHHGRFWHNKDGEYGMAARKTLIDRLRAEAKSKDHIVLLLSGGDINTGVPESDLQYAEPDFKGMRLLNYDAMAIGNHEFDNPLHVLDKQIEWAQFPVLSANILNKADDSYAYQPYTIIKQQGLNIAVLGLTTTDTTKIANPEYLKALKFISPTQATQRVLAEIKSQHHIDLAIAVTHMGHYHNAVYGINAPGDVTLARNLAAGQLDMIIGGHSQEPICVDKQGNDNPHFSPGKACHPDQQNGTWIMQAHEWGKYVGRAVFKITDGKKSLLSYELIPVNLKDEQGNFIADYIEHNQEMLDLLTPFQAIGEGQLKETVGSTDAYLDGKRDTVRFKQSPLARLIIKAQKEAVNADFGFISGGGIRHSISAGEISAKDILKVHPFKNKISLMQWRGSALVHYLNVITAFPVDAGAYLQYEGISFDRVNGKVGNIKINGQPFNPEATYRMSINSYNASGGDGYPILLNKKGYQETKLIDADVLTTYIQRHSPIKVNSL